LVLAFVLGRQMEQAFRQSLILSDGSFLVFFTRPISAGAMALAAFLGGLQFVAGVFLRLVLDPRASARGWRSRASTTRE
jgi:TctA family transporter